MTPTLAMPGATPLGGRGAPDEAEALFDKLKGPLKALIDNEIHGDSDPEKLLQYSDLRKADYYWRGIQFLRPTMSGDGQIVDWSPVDGSVVNNLPAADLYDYSINDYRGYGRKFIGVTAQQPPNLKCLPRKRGNEVQTRHAETAQGLWEVIQNAIRYHEQNRLLFFGFYKSGSQFLHQAFVADGEKYGYIEEPVMEMVQKQIGPATLRCMECGFTEPMPDAEMPPRACPQCGREYGPEDYQEPQVVPWPTQTGTKRYARGFVENHIYSSLQVKTPFWIRNLADTPWLVLQYEEFKGKILAAFADDEAVYGRLKALNESDSVPMSTGSAADQYGRFTRDLVTSQRGFIFSTRKNRWSYQEAYLRPSMYEIAAGDPFVDGEDQVATYRRLYPDGMKVIVVQGQIVKIGPVKLDDEWVMAIPEVAENAYPDPIGKDMMAAQDLSNTCTNTMVETLERQIPQIFIDVDKINMEARKKHQLPASAIPVRRSVGQRLGDAIANVPVAKAEPEQVTYPDYIRNKSAENIGITPAIYGGGDVEPTAYATNLKRNQAMLQLAPQLDAGREAWAATAYNLIRLFAKHSDGTIPERFVGDADLEAQEIRELLAEDWRVEPDDSLPLSWAERRATMLEMLDKGPLVQQMLGFQQIENIPQVQDNLVGLSDWKLPNQDALAKVNFMITQLRNQQPVQTVDPFTGMPSFQPSLPIDNFEDDHGFVAQAIRNWAQTKDAIRLRQQNPAGYANVILWGTEHAKIAAMAMTQPPPGMPEAPPAGPGGPPQAGGPGGANPPQPEGQQPQGPQPPKLQPPAGGDQAQVVPPQ